MFLKIVLINCVIQHNLIIQLQMQGHLRQLRKNFKTVTLRSPIFRVEQELMPSILKSHLQ